MRVFLSNDRVAANLSKSLMMNSSSIRGKPIVTNCLIDKFYAECMGDNPDIGNWDAYAKVKRKLYDCPSYIHNPQNGWWEENVYKSLRHEAYRTFFPANRIL